MEKVLTFIAILVLLSLLLALPVMWLWDAVMPELFGLKEITFLQALWLTLLFRALIPTSTSTEK